MLLEGIDYMENRNRLQQRIDTVLTVMFLVVIFVFGIMTVMQDPEGFHKGFASRSRLSDYLPDPEHYSQWDMLAARIKALDGYIAENGWLADELGEINSTMQYCIGKKMIATGSTQMVTLNTGHLYDLQKYVPMDGAVSDITAMSEICGDIPFLFVYEHPTLYDEAAQMPSDYACLDESTKMADDLIAGLDAAGIRYMDSREVLTNSGMQLTEYLMYTDQHWSTRAAIEMASHIATEVTEMTGVALDTSRIAPEQLNTRVYEKLFLGKYGQRIGTSNIDPDDITIYWPTYETNIHRYSVKTTVIMDETGPFYDSVIRWQYLEPDEGKTWNIRGYCDYGLVDNYDLFENPDGADVTILLLKDSYSAPIGAFLSLMAKNVVSVDLRRSDMTLSEIIEKYHPDVVVNAYSLQMLKQEKYAFE